ncbi:hypothetical protein KRX51_08320 [Corynebacterium sp. TAE3-ERU12]|uniref:hypothetical protein n=1 Tax=Corynebacterium sp. TAE3-ERU12 TaxID=2849491 RepID=UPI001C458110|nr:hypothetical protein [Corynebacterium sp. TAE3-ERU12]MBV7295912.1 hypothetical protein [Corynebacterium sp. TAE3-ERU12]
MNELEESLRECWEWVNARIPASVSREWALSSLEDGDYDGAIDWLLNFGSQQGMVPDEVFDQLEQWHLWGLDSEILAYIRSINAENREKNK